MYSEVLGGAEGGQFVRDALRGPPSPATPSARSPRASSFRPPASPAAKAGGPAAPAKAAQLEPKVMAAHRPRAGEPPRAIVIERTRREYARLDVAELLRARGVDYSADGTMTHHCSGERAYLKLELFDDTSFEEREPVSGWLAFGPAAARALRVGEDGRGSWHAAEVRALDEATGLFEVRFDGGEPARLPRIHVAFRLENPVAFADRVAAAHRARLAAERALRETLAIDSMPSDGLPALDAEQAGRITALAAQAGEGVDTSSYLAEINTAYQRVQNEITFRAQRGGAGEGGEPSGASAAAAASSSAAPSPSEDPSVPASAVVPVPPHPYPERLSELCFRSFLTVPAVVGALGSINAECERVASMPLLSAATFGRATRLDEFASSQRGAIATLSQHVREVWPATLAATVRNGLGSMGKGSYNLAEKRRETHDASKLHRLLAQVNLRMSDTLRTLSQRGVADYVGRLVDACRPGAPTPLFRVSLVSRDGVRYKEAPRDHAVLPLAVLDEALAAVQGVPQVEPLLMNNLFLDGTPPVPSVNAAEPWVRELRERAESALAAALEPLDEHLGSFARLDELLRLDADEYVAAFFGGGDDAGGAAPSPAAVRAEVGKHRKEAAALRATYPSRARVGGAEVEAEEVLQRSEAKLEQLVQKLLHAYCGTVRASCAQITEGFQRVESGLKRQPRSVEELTEARQYVASVPQLVAEQDEATRDALAGFELLEECKFRAGKDVLRQRWQVFGHRRAVTDLAARQTRLLSAARRQFVREVRGQQEELATELADAEAKVAGFAQHTTVDRAHPRAVALNEQVASLVARSSQFNDSEGLLDLPPTDYARARRLAKEFEPYFQLWDTAHRWRDKSALWQSCPFSDLDPEEVPELVTTSGRAIVKALKSRAVRENPALLQVAHGVQEDMGRFKPLLPLVVSLRGPGMRERHWEALSEAVGGGAELRGDDPELTLERAAGELGLLSHMDAVSAVGDTAAKEYQIESALDRMEEAWRGVEFDVADYKDTRSYVLRGVDEVTAILDEHVVTTQAMLFSPDRKHFEERIAEWDAKLRLVGEVADEWLAVQRAWLALQPIFSSPDIAKQLPAESKKFAGVDKTWRHIMAQAHASPGALGLCDNGPLLVRLQEATRTLDTVSKRLADYLDSKRAAFARFYFLSNDELLQILSQAREPLAVQPYLKKLFENVERLEFGESKEALAVVSAHGERVPLASPVSTAGQSIEHWLGALEDEIRRTLRGVVRDAVADGATRDRAEWVRAWAGQAVLNGSQVHWTRRVEAALREGRIAEFAGEWFQQLLGMVALVRTDLTAVERLTMGALIVLDVHARDVVDRLVRERCASAGDFAWQCQMRYYEDAEAPASAGPGAPEGLRVQMVQASFDYDYEYMGNSLRLVITPLTDRCYMTLMSALQMHLGGAPAGPAGTGKTETVKDLAKAVAKQCVVFNCSDGLDHLAMRKFFKGLASSGAWACFDEFNRIDIEVLSVVAQQIATIWAAVRAGVDHFVFEGSDIRLVRTCSAFITMNPGYAGRTELPENLKALFRPVAMMVPDYALIAEIMLYSFGFEEAKTLARKMVATFRLSSEQLSAQDHYDYGMRAVKTVITRAGFLKRAEPDEKEDRLLLRALRDVNVPKFLSQDLPLFEGIVSDLFSPDTVAAVAAGSAAAKGGKGAENAEKGENADSGDGAAASPVARLPAAIEAASASLGLQAVEPFVEKCMQLYETTVVRHGLMMVGPTGGGKTSALRVLAAAMTATDGFEDVVTRTLNPKAVTMGQLYGEFDEATHEWSDGILANQVREFIADGSPTRKWLVFDGPVDAIWIENMNTVLDDNKKLCLVSGEILQLTGDMTMIFEVEDLSVASPATVSRCGMVYMEPEAIGLAPLVRSWVEALPAGALTAAARAELERLFDALLAPAVAYVRRHCPEPVPTVDTQLCTSMLHLLECFLLAEDAGDADAGDAGDAGDADAAGDNVSALAAANTPAATGALFVASLVWSVGGSTTAEGRAKFDRFLRPLLAEASAPAPPERGTVYDFWFDRAAGAWAPWMRTGDDAPGFQFDPVRTPFAEIIVPTVDSVRHARLLDLLVRRGRHVLFTGETGTGKTVGVQQYLASGLPDGAVPLSLAFSAATSANGTEDLLVSKMEKRRKNMYGPPVGQRFVVFVDDLNMPAREKYLAQPPIELLRQWMDHGGWYDRKTLAFRRVVDVQYVAAMGPPGGGRNPVTARFLRHFSQVAHPEHGEESVRLIFGTIFRGCAGAFADEIRDLADALVDATSEVYRTIRAELLPTPSRSFYTFNMRDLSKVFGGVLGASAARVTAVPQFLRLWVHECRRVFQDRLVCDEDREWLDSLLARVCEQRFGRRWDDLVPADGVLLFGDYMNGDGGGGGGSQASEYGEIEDAARLAKVMEERLAAHNEEHEDAPMHLVLFADAVEHVSRVSRVLRQPGGNALLLGVGGSGRQSLTRLAAHIADMEVARVEVTRSYSQQDWRDDLRAVVMRAGLREEATVFLFSDAQVVHESFLEDINSLLGSGDVPGLFAAQEDRDAIFSACKSDCQAAGVPATRLNAHSRFVARVRRHLHVVLCMSPVGDAFRNRLRMYPNLVNCCTLDWFSAWPAEALASVARRKLAGLDLGGDADGVVRVCQRVHQSVEESSVQFLAQLRRHNHVTPTSYLELLSAFSGLLGERRDAVGGLRARLQGGLDKLGAAQRTVAALQIELTEKQPVLKRTQAEVAAMMEQIKKDTESAAATKEAVERQEAEASAKADECKEIRDDAQRDLDKALPLLDQAVECLNELKKSDIDEVRAMKKPPSGVRLTMEAACIMLGKKPVMRSDPAQVGKKVADYWETAQKDVLSNAKQLLETLRGYDKDNIADGVIKKIAPYIDREDFQIKAIEKASKACTAIAMWVHAMFSYYHVAREVEPKRQRLRGAEASLSVVEAALAEAKERLAAVEQRIAALTDKYNAAVAQQEALTAEVETCKVKLVRADKLIGGLGGEKARWEATVEKLGGDYANLVGDVLVAAASVSYLGPFTGEFRASLTAAWRESLAQAGVPHTPGVDLRAALADPLAEREWAACGLPSDDVSVQNGITISKARRWPLMIDPQGQANAFVRRLGGDSVEVVRLGDKNAMRAVENCVRFGRFALIEDVGEELDPALEPLLARRVFQHGGQPHIRIGDAVVPYNASFRLFMTTRLPNPNYPPELQVQISLLNFTTTRAGLGQQMLGVVVARESPETERKKSELVLASAKMAAQLDEIESTTLRLLSESEGDILADEALINTLSESKKTSTEIAARAAEAAVVEKEIDAARRAYAPVARRAAALYFVVSDLAGVDPMYQYSLAWFTALFDEVITDTPAGDSLEERLELLQSRLTRAVYDRVSVGLFARHRLIFSFLLAAAAAADSAGAGEADASPMARLAVLRERHADRVMDGIREYVAATLGPEYVESDPFSVRACHAKSASTRPVVLVLARGADPAAELDALAEELGCRASVVSVSLGQGQGVVAERAIADAVQAGTWVVLQNAHLAVSWLPALERIVQALDADSVHPGFRLWLTSMPEPRFPVAVLQQSVKAVVEPPTGVRASLMAALAAFEPDSFDSSPAAFRRLAFNACRFHASVLERRRYGPLGLNIPYAFMSTDLSVSVDTIRHYVSEGSEVPYETLRYLIGLITYGGRVTDAADNVTMESLLLSFVREEGAGGSEEEAAATLDEYRAQARALEPQAPPEDLGLHPNAAITLRREEADAFFGTVASLMPRGAGAGAGQTREEIVAATVADIQRRLPEPFDLHDLRERFPSARDACLNTVLVQEAERFVALLAVMRSTLGNLAMALTGAAVMSDALDSMADSIVADTVPEAWTAAAYPSLKPLAGWVDDLVARLAFFEGWCTGGATPSSFPLSAFFFPQGLLTGGLQLYARKNRVAIDSIAYEFEVLEEGGDGAGAGEDGLVVTGLFLEGCRWDAEARALAESRPGELYTELPPLLLRPRKVREEGAEAGQAADAEAGVAQTFSCPVYKTLERRGTLSTTGHSSNFVMHIRLPTTESPDRWVRAGAAVFCSLR